MAKHDPTYAPQPPEHPDQWHRHTPDEGTPQEEHAPAANPYYLGGLMAVLTLSFVALLVVVVLYYFNYTTKIRREKIESTLPSKESYAYREESLKLLDQGSYRWVDLTKGEAVQVPLPLAIDKVLAHYGGGR